MVKNNTKLGIEIHIQMKYSRTDSEKFYYSVCVTGGVNYTALSALLICTSDNQSGS